MTISSGSGGPRHVGRIVDPSVREDGDSEPELQLVESATGPEAATESNRDSEGAVSPKPSGDEAAPPAPALASDAGASDPSAPALTDTGEAAFSNSGEVAATGASENALAASNEPALPAPALAPTTEPALAPTTELALAPTTEPALAPTTANTTEPAAVATGEAASTNAHAAGAPHLPSSVGGHPVRDKLLERARALKAESTLPHAVPAQSPSALGPRRGLAEFDEMAEPRTARDNELESVGTPRARLSATAPLGPSRGQLSPTMVAVFGSLIGLATVASLIALAMNFDGEAGTLAKPAASTGAAVVEAKPKPPVGAVPERKRQKLPGPWRIADAKNDPTTRVVEGKVGRNAFLVALADAGVAQKEAYRLLIAYKGVRDLDKCDRDDAFRALIERGTGRLKAFEYQVSPEEVYQAREDQNGYLKAGKLDLKVGRQQIMGAFMFDGESVDSSSKPAGFDKGLREALAKALDGHMDVGELERGDRLRVVAQEVTVLGEFARYAGIEALEVLPRNSKSKPLRIYYFHHASAGGYYSERGQAPYEGGWRKPIKDAPVTSKFNPTRMHPVLKKIMPHTGTDFGAPSGTPVGASSYGTISFIGPAGPSGNLVKIEHPGSIETGYAHLSRFAEGLSVGDKVKRLELIGYVGSTGRSTGPHLHFTAKRDGKFFDAETLNLDAMRVIDTEHRSDFEKVKQGYDKLLNAIPLPPPTTDPPEAELASAKAPGGPSPTGAATDRAAGDDEGEGEPSGAGDGEGDGSEGSDDGSLGSHDEADTAEPAPAAAAPAAAAPAAAAPAGPPAGAPAKPSDKGAAAVYLTDKELLEMQSKSDDGEVDE